ncbi:hypothetical protein [Alkalimonas sp.]|uniref:hypothetical protein n=1 Tax=Alkalimonas sp. TaxID=1872453 RepID=UPI00263B13CD|nr:hypothetical protein [Alkalimonas sp.]MCC5827262.1 hypothetical protein [Alkalimonas sp.]
MSKYFEPITAVFGIFMDKRKAEATYKNLYPSLQVIVNLKGRHSPTARGLLEVFASLPASGAKSRNFRKRYIDNPNGWKELPSDPARIPFGFWH